MLCGESPAQMRPPDFEAFRLDNSQDKWYNDLEFINAFISLRG